MADPCQQAKVIERIEDRIKELEQKVGDLTTFGAETKVYMKQVLDTQEEIKKSIQNIQQELRDRPAQQAPAAPAQAPTQNEWVKFLIQNLFDLLRWVLIIAGAALGVKEFLPK